MEVSQHPGMKCAGAPFPKQKTELCIEHFCLFYLSAVSHSQVVNKFVAKTFLSNFKELLFYTGTNAKSAGNIPKFHEAFQ